MAGLRENWCRFSGGSILIWISEASNFCYWKTNKKNPENDALGVVWPKSRRKHGTGQERCPGISEESWVNWEESPCVGPLSCPSRLQSMPCDTLFMSWLRATTTPNLKFMSAGRGCQDSLCLILSLCHRLPPCMKPAFRGASCATSRGCRWTGSASISR